MNIRKLWRKYLKRHIWHIIGVFLFIYFSFHMVSGNRGLITLWKLQSQLLQAKLTLSKNQSLLADKTNLVQKMRSNSLDYDLLEIQIRKLLNYIDKDEIVLKNIEYDPSFLKNEDFGENFIGNTNQKY